MFSCTHGDSSTVAPPSFKLIVLSLLLLLTKPHLSTAQIEICLLPPPLGDGEEAPVIRYYFNNSKRDCIPFNYTGAESNHVNNLFYTNQTCRDFCLNPPTYPPTAPPTAPPTSSLDICLLEKNIGNNIFGFPTLRFFHNKTSHQCQPFNYYGGSGNANNFLTLDECKERCIIATTTVQPSSSSSTVSYHHSPSSSSPGITADSTTPITTFTYSSTVTTISTSVFTTILTTRSTSIHPVTTIRTQSTATPNQTTVPPTPNQTIATPTQLSGTLSTTNIILSSSSSGSTSLSSSTDSSITLQQSIIIYSVLFVVLLLSVSVIIVASLAICLFIHRRRLDSVNVIHTEKPNNPPSSSVSSMKFWFPPSDPPPPLSSNATPLSISVATPSGPSPLDHPNGVSSSTSSCTSTDSDKEGSSDHVDVIQFH